MRRRVALARALINDPKVLLMDEPFVSLDQPTSENLYKTLVNYRKKKPITVIFITHVLKEALLLGDRILFFSKKPGTVVYDYKIKSKSFPLTLDSKSVDDEYKKLKKKTPYFTQWLGLNKKKLMEELVNYIDKGGLIFSLLLIMSGIGITQYFTNSLK